ncbi:hypothetical protein [Kitasatospora albolonga]|uniref:hypothetical protein n=1 Tax=Kitasatospora albolonga TaxID=68173 RepID=UPI0035F0F7FB
MRLRATAAIAAALLAATACSSIDTSTPAAAPALNSAAPSGPTASTSAARRAPDAKTVTERLAKTLPVKLTVTYDATTDPNGKLGRPHQYLSKTAFDDTRVSNSPKAKEDESKGRRDSISYGGTVEVFATPEDAETWMRYVDSMQAAFGALVTPDYLYRSGVTVVRVSHLLTAEQAKAYEAAIR